MVHGEVHEHNRRKEGKHHGRRGRGRRAFVAGYLAVMIAEIESDLPVDYRLHQQPHDGEPGQRRNPFRFLQPHRADGGGILDPAKARFHGAMLFLIRLENLGIRTHRWPHSGGQDGPPVHVLGGDQGLCVHDQAIADLDLGCLGLRRTASTRPLFGGTDRFHTIVESMIAPKAWLAAPPSLTTAFIVGDGRLGVGRTGKPSGFNALDVLCNALGLVGLGGGVGHGRLLGQLAGVHDEKTELFQSESPVSVFHFHLADDTVPVPASRRLLACPARFFES